MASLAAAGRLHRVHRGVYAVGHIGLTPEGRWLAAVKACGPVAALSHFSLAMLFELMPVEDRLPEVTVVHGRRRAPEGVRVHRTRSLHPEDVWRHRGIPTTSPERLLLDLAARLDDRPLRALMSRAQSMRLTNLRRLARQLDRAAGRPGRACYARVLASRPPATRTELEDRVFDLVLAGGFARPDDAERQALPESHGERVVRVTWAQATAHAAQTLRRIEAAGAPTPRARP
jgi:hypothetical protein